MGQAPTDHRADHRTADPEGDPDGGQSDRPETSEIRRPPIVTVASPLGEK
jgi:hypothetical protein